MDAVICERFIMKCLDYRVLFTLVLLLVGSANAGIWPNSVFVMNVHTGTGITVGTDYSILESLTYRGQEWRYIYDARVGYIMNYTWVFGAVCPGKPGDK